MHKCDTRSARSRRNRPLRIASNLARPDIPSAPPACCNTIFSESQKISGAHVTSNEHQSAFVRTCAACNLHFKDLNYVRSGVTALTAIETLEGARVTLRPVAPGSMLCSMIGKNGKTKLVFVLFCSCAPSTTYPSSVFVFVFVCLFVSRQFSSSR